MEVIGFFDCAFQVIILLRHSCDWTESFVDMIPEASELKGSRIINYMIVLTAQIQHYFDVAKTLDLKHKMGEQQKKLAVFFLSKMHAFRTSKSNAVKI